MTAGSLENQPVFHLAIRSTAPAALYVGLPEVLRQAESLGLKFPRELRILALEVGHPFESHGEMSPATREALPGYVDRARQVLKNWTTLS